MSWSRGIQGSTAKGGAFVTLRPVTPVFPGAAAPMFPGAAAPMFPGAAAPMFPGAAAPMFPGAAAPGDVRSMRLAARDAYQLGRVRDAAELQTRMLRLAEETEQVQPEDYSFLGLCLSSLRQNAETIACLREGLARFPDDAMLHENLGVLLLGTNACAEAIVASERALALGSESPNILDCITDAHARLGRPDLAVVYGRRALEAKDRKFGAAPPLARLPSGLLPVFNAANPAENVIAYCLWGNEPRYHVPLLENARIRPHLFPGWSIRVYHDHSVDPSYLALLRERDVDLRSMSLAPDQPAHRKLLWRFNVASDPAVRRFLCRDADSLLTVKERVAVDAWLASDYPFHTMRDWYSHTDLLLAGMWGGVGGILPPLPTLLAAYRGWRVEHDHVDQDLLSETVWPIVRGHVLIHDSIFAPCLGSVPFPPFGDLPPSMHIGQNAFLHFERSA